MNRTVRLTLIGCIGFGVGILTHRCARAEWKPEYAAAPQAARDWYQNAELTPEARKRFPFTKCCDHSDVVKTRFEVNKTDAGDEWYWLDGDKWRRVPPDIIHGEERAPGGQPVLFVYAGQPTCFFLPESGI